MNVIIPLIFSLCVPLTVGCAIVFYVFRKNPLPMPLALSFAFGVGTGTLTLWMFVIGITNMNFNVPLITFPLLLLSGGLLLWGRKDSVEPKQTINVGSLSKSFKNEFVFSHPVHAVYFVLMAAYILYYVYTIFWVALNMPLLTFDSMATLSFRAKIFFYEKSLVDLNTLPHPSYPLYMQLLQTWIGLCLGFWSDQLIKIIFPIICCSTLIIFYYFLREWTNKFWALMGITLLMSSGDFVLHAGLTLRDFSLMSFNCTTIILLMYWHQKKDDAILILAGLTGGLATFVKLEGTSYLAIYYLLFAMLLFSKQAKLRKQWKGPAVRFVGPSFSICVSYHLYKLFNVTANFERSLYDFTFESLQRIPIILTRYFEALFLRWEWNILWFLLIVILLSTVRQKRRIEVQFFCWAILMFLGLYFIFSLFTIAYVGVSGREVWDALPRIILHFFPLAVFIIVLRGHQLSGLTVSNKAE